MNNEQPILVCKDIHKVYHLNGKAIQVLQGLSMQVPAGTSVAVMGASGAGKSTLLHILGGLDRPEKGAVAFCGTDVYKLSSRKRSRWLANEVGFVFQSYHLLPELTIVENVMLPAMSLKGALARTSQDRKRALELLDRVGLADRAEHRCTELSGGEQQRASLARALMNSPSIIFADEPTGNLDSETGGLVLEYLFKLQKENRQTLVAVTHNSDVSSRTDRVLHLREGRLLENEAEG